jgi:nucleoside-diphosphate-sugar epimerase
MAKALVTGATGLVGSHLVERLLERGDRVWALVRPTSRVDFLKEQGVELVYGDLNDLKSLRSVVQGTDTIYHCAARPPLGGTAQQFYRDNVEGTQHLLEASLQAPLERFVHVSTVDVYGYDHHDGADESTPLKPDGLYSRSKIEAERVVMDYYQRYRLPVVILRPCLIYGPRDRHLLPAVLQLLTLRRVPLVRGGRALLDLVYVGDVAEALVLASTREEAIGQAYNITDGARRTLREIVETFARAWGQKPRFLSIPYPLAYGTAALVSSLSYWLRFPTPAILRWEVIKAMGHHRHFSISKASHELGYRPKVDLELGLKLTLEWNHAQISQAISQEQQ